LSVQVKTTNFPEIDSKFETQCFELVRSKKTFEKRSRYLTYNVKKSQDFSLFSLDVAFSSVPCVLFNETGHMRGHEGVKDNNQRLIDIIDEKRENCTSVEEI